MKKFLTLCLLLVPSLSFASTITFNYNGTFSNNTVPGGTTPYVVATFNDTTAAAGYDVRLTVTTPGLVGTEFLSELNFNLNTLISPLNVTANIVNDPDATQVFFGTNAFQADGDGRYDVQTKFSTSGANRFTAGETLVIDFNLINGTLLANDFNFFAQPAGGNGPFLTAGHIQSIATGDGSTWIFGTGVNNPPPPPPPPPPGDDPGDPNTVPEPATLVLFGTGLLFIVSRSRKLRNSK